MWVTAHQCLTGQRGQADLDACIRLHNTQRAPSGLGYPNPAGMFGGDSA